MQTLKWVYKVKKIFFTVFEFVFDFSRKGGGGI